MTKEQVQQKTRKFLGDAGWPDELAKPVVECMSASTAASQQRANRWANNRCKAIFKETPTVRATTLPFERDGAVWQFTEDGRKMYHGDVTISDEEEST